ncbi:hypothetical protein RRG08_017668 [Elysia crispata]|uniref:Uncharacterized protein n=1 Tax=Elysia crispata TaxID=231223 RepID=A0AAE0ZD67_9GAST|nr:hypothetical protein RRG08_017668 [Elysia crispata]
MRDEEFLRPGLEGKSPVLPLLVARLTAKPYRVSQEGSAPKPAALNITRNTLLKEHSMPRCLNATREQVHCRMEILINSIDTKSNKRSFFMMMLKTE